MKPILLIIGMILAAVTVKSQQGDTVKKYLDEKFQLTDKRNSAHTALAIRENDHWYLTTDYPDGNGPLFKIYFKDKNLTIYDGPRTIYHQNKTKSEEITLRDNVANGLFRSWYENGTLKDSGQYVDGKKSGQWRSWYADGTLESSGLFNTNLREGDWNWYYENGKISTKETYAKNKISKLECYDADGKYSGDRCGIAKMPIPQGNFTSIDAFLQDNISWSKDMTNLLTSGTWIVKLKFTISKTGSLTDVSVVDSPNEVFTKEALRLIALVPEWIPAVSHNRIVEHSMEFQIPFTR